MSSDERNAMPDDVVIRFENISKRYKRTFGGLRHLVQDAADRLFGRNDGAPPEERYLWALNDVSFEVYRGEILGIIGLNGAGKSTILKLATRITHPTTGNIEVKGQVGALIEVGAGFHAELTGQENVFLNGSILGMSRQDIEEKYESIVEFAELDGFMDMPVKRYSSGMYVRLGFAVAAHLDPEIFLIDEVLSVGDMGFQAKCINKINELKASGTTIVLVSHNMVNISHYCDRVLWIDLGKTMAEGDPESVVDQYIEFIRLTKKHDLSHFVAKSNETLTSNKRVEITEVFLTDEHGHRRDVFECGDVAQVHILYMAHQPVINPVFEIAIRAYQGQLLGRVTTLIDDFKLGTVMEPGHLVFSFEPLIFFKGAYALSIFVRDEDSIEFYGVSVNCATLIIKGDGISQTKASGHINYPHSWKNIA
jgi:lipopolysaccharide transport system ATP-binding protein